MTKQFKVGDKVRLLKLEGAICGFEVGDTCEVIQVNSGGRYYYGIKKSRTIGFVDGENIEIISPKSKKPNRIAELESRIAELERHFAEVTSLFIAKERLTPNQQRKATVERAKAFVTKHRPVGGYRTEYVVNADKRTVVALVFNEYFGFKAGLCAKGIAKCAPDDVFNADIGKAIALGRALGLDVSEFENAPKPTEVISGMKIDLDDKGKSEVNSYLRKNGVIIDDTEAKY